MSVDFIDGTVVEAPVKIRRKPFVRYDHIVFARPDGGTQRIDNPIAASAIAAAIVPGAQGRFYLYKTIDMKGIHGVRLADGTALHAYPGNNEWIFGILLAVNIAWIAMRLARDGSVPILALLMIALGVTGLVLTRSSRAETRRQFDSDREPGPSEPAAMGAVAP
jgi:hypothetical protein